MNSMIQILTTVLTAVSCSFIQTSSNQIQSRLNSTFFLASERLFKPIYIPNIVNYSEHPQTSKTKVLEGEGAKTKEMILKSILDSEEISQESRVRENYSDEDSKTTANPLKFSSRYSTKQEDSSKGWTSSSKETEKPREDNGKIGNSSRITGIRNLLEKTEKTTTSSKSDDIPQTENNNLFSDRLDELDDSEEELEELIEIAPTTNEPYSELSKPTSYRKYTDEEDFDNYETTSTEIEETDNSEEMEKEDEEGKKLIDDYYNSGSKNYHSIQTPLNEIKYRGHHFKPEKIRTRLVGAISRRPLSHNWPYSRPQIRGELEKLNEISDGDDSYEKVLDEGVRKEAKIETKQLGLELAVEKDELKFDRNKKYNPIDERNRQKHQQKNLSIEEDKDDKTPLFQSLKQYQVDEKESNYQPKLNIKEEGIWSTKSTFSTTPENIFKLKTPPKRQRQPKNFNISSELTSNFQNHRFLGPIIFNHNLEQQTIKGGAKPFSKTQKQPVRETFLKGLLENEKLDQDKLTNQRIQKSIFENLSKEISFNHLEESEEMYNAILANIRSVFGAKIQPGKSDLGNQREESKSFTWSLPLTKREKVN